MRQYHVAPLKTSGPYSYFEPQGRPDPLLSTPGMGPHPAPPTQGADRGQQCHRRAASWWDSCGIRRDPSCNAPVCGMRAPGWSTVFDYVLCDQFLASPTTRARPCWTTCARAAAAVFHRVLHGHGRGVLRPPWPRPPNRPWTATCSNPSRPARCSSARHGAPAQDPSQTHFRRHRAEGLRAGRRAVRGAFRARKPYWLYAARIWVRAVVAAGPPRRARTLFEAVIAARALPWAKLGVARAQIESGQAARHHHLAGADWRGRLVRRRLRRAGPRAGGDGATLRRPSRPTARPRPHARLGGAAAEAGDDVVLHGRPRHRHQGAGARHGAGH